MTVGVPTTTPVTVYTSEHRLYTIGDGFALMFQSLGQHQPSYKIEDDRLCINTNETSASLLASFDFHSNDLEHIADDIDLTVLVKDGHIDFVAGYYENLPIYSPYHAMTKEGELYEIEALITTPENTDIKGDELLKIPNYNKPCNRVRNVGRQWVGPVVNTRLTKSDRLQAAIPVES